MDASKPNPRAAAEPSYLRARRRGVGVATSGTNGPGGPFNPTTRASPILSYITVANNNYESNYNGLQVTLTGRNYHGLSFTAGYTLFSRFGQASDQGTSADFPAPLNSYANPRQSLYTDTDFDVRHRFTLSINYAHPWKEGLRTTSRRMGPQLRRHHRKWPALGRVRSYGRFQRDQRNLDPRRSIRRTVELLRQAQRFHAGPRFHRHQQWNRRTCPYFAGGVTVLAPTSNAAV